MSGEKEDPSTVSVHVQDPTSASATTVDRAVATPSISPSSVSTRLPAFPPHAVVKSASLVLLPSADAAESDAKTISDNGEALGEGLRWKPHLKTDGPDSAKPPVAIRGKRDVRKYGWGHLPPQVLRLVLSHAVADVSMVPTLQDRWAWSGPSTEVLAAITTRERLAELRRVCVRWRAAIDNHPFWWHLIKVLYPAYDMQAADAASMRISLNSSRSGSAARAGPTLFRRARLVSFSICIPCRMNGPNTLEVARARPDLIVPVEGMEWVATCQFHEERTCGACLLAETPTYNRIGLFPSSEGEVDAYDDYRSLEVVICRHCRRSALEAAILRQLRSCAREGGIIRGDLIPWSDFPEWKEYVAFGTDTARTTAESLVARWAMTCQGRYTFLSQIARELQRRESLMKWRFHQAKAPETFDERDERWQLLRTFDPYGPVDPKRDEENMRRLYTAWEWEWNNEGSGLWDQMREEYNMPGLNPKYTGLLLEAATSDFLVERFRIGIWVLPSVEADVLSFQPRLAPQPIQPDPHTSTSPLLDLIASTSHPFPKHPKTDCLDRPHPKGIGLFRLEPTNALSAELILPPSLIIQTMDERYMGWMRRQLLPPLRRMVDDIVLAVGDDAAAEVICEGMGLKEVLQGLRGETVWLKPGARAQRERAVAAANAAAVALAQLEKEGPPASPRVELVRDEKVEEAPTSHIHIIHEEPVVVNQPKEASSTSTTTLGKRKTPPAELPRPTRPAERESRESSAPLASATVTTSSSTPEDVVMPVTPDEAPTSGLVTGGGGGGQDATLESIAKMAVKLKGDGDGDVNGGGEVISGVEVEVDMSDEELSSEEGSEFSYEAGRGADGHYEQDYHGANGQYGEDELEMDRQMREDNEMMDGELLEEEDESEEDYEDEDEEMASGNGNGGINLKSNPKYHTNSKSAYLPPPPPTGPFPSTSELIMPMQYVPFVPLPASDDPDDPVMRFLAKDVIMCAWYDVRKHLRVCRCGICERGRAKEVAK